MAKSMEGRSGGGNGDAAHVGGEAPTPPKPLTGELGALAALEGAVADLSKRIESMEGKRGAHEAKPYPCPHCQCTRTPIRGGTHFGRAIGVPGTKHYRECAACGWTFSTFVPSEGPLKGTEITPA